MVDAYMNTKVMITYGTWTDVFYIISKRHFFSIHKRQPIAIKYWIIFLMAILNWA